MGGPYSPTYTRNCIQCGLQGIRSNSNWVLAQFGCCVEGAERNFSTSKRPELKVHNRSIAVPGNNTWTQSQTISAIQLQYSGSNGPRMLRMAFDDCVVYLPLTSTLIHRFMDAGTQLPVKNCS
mmetsp:Transcript_69451/g.185306  ORF Transcript_69451/g.185306 Transcript_69451/m.185306 type:complete len:123 (-) Transcript_69451:273-641(-)